MRQERDSLGEVQLSDEEYFGIGTARLLNAVTIRDPGFPREILHNILRVRHAQAIAFGRNKSWSAAVTAGIESAVKRMEAPEFPLSKHIRVRPQHGGGARTIILNVDEVLANVALEEMGNLKGEYHLVAPLFQMDRGIHPIATYQTAVHITLLEELDVMNEAFDSLLLALKRQAGLFQTQVTLATIQFQEVEISDIGAEFSRCYESLLRSRQQLEGLRACLRPCWQGPPEALLALRELVGIELAVSKSPHDFPWNADLYVGVSAFLKSSAMILLHFCNRMRFLIGCSKELDLPRVRANPAFNPGGREFLIPDTVSQFAFSIIGGDAALVSAVCASVDSATAYAPMISSQLVWCSKWLTESLLLLEQKFVSELTGTVDRGEKNIEQSQLQAEKLIPVLGYERAVQVARIAALTEKPVRTVVHKMKLLTAEQTARYLPLTVTEEESSSRDDL